MHLCAVCTYTFVGSKPARDNHKVSSKLYILKVNKEGEIYELKMARKRENANLFENSHNTNLKPNSAFQFD